MSDMYELRAMAKKLGVKLGEELPTKAGSVIRTKSGILILRVWNNMDGTGSKYAWTDGVRDIPVVEFGNDWELVK